MILEQGTINVEIPVGYERYELEDGEHHLLFTIEPTEEVIGRVGIVVEGDTLQQAKEEFLKTLKVHLRWEGERSRELDKWKPFQKGNWKHIGGTWFNIFGLNFYFRKGKNMKGGFYIPLTNLNIMFTNHWALKKCNT